MRDCEIIVLVDGHQSPVNEFVFAANLARVLTIGTVRCIATECRRGNSGLQILLPGGSGEQTFTSGGGAVSVFELPRRRWDAAHDGFSGIGELRRAARALGVSFGGYERVNADIEMIGNRFRCGTIVVAASVHRTGSLAANQIAQRLIAQRAAHVVYCPARPVAYQRLILDANDPGLGELLTWGFDWSRRLSVPLYLVSAERTGGRPAYRNPWLTRVFDWLGMEARIRPTQCSLEMLQNELKPADLLLTSTDGSVADPTACFGRRLSQLLAESRCAVGVQLIEGDVPLAFARVTDDNFLCPLPLVPDTSYRT